MSAETRWKLPDWHQRPVRWKVFMPRFTPDEWKEPDLKPHVFPIHRRSSCLTIYNPLGIQPSIEGTYRIDGPNWIKL